MSSVAARLTPEAGPAEAAPDGLYEVVDGAVVEKTMGVYEGQLARMLVVELSIFVRQHKLGTAEIELLFLIDPARGLKRRPDVAFVSRDRWPIGRNAPSLEVWDVVPDLAVEVVSPSNSANEVLIKVGDYFRSGVREVWVIYPVGQVAHIYEGPKTVRILDRDESLEGGAILPGFQLPLADLFAIEAEPG